ncbi:MAG TPA: hypothetical protein VNZ62_18860 [Capillimicrobium sp.]|nr:hypothetical protein [Capillimicrobium sp.]
MARALAWRPLVALGLISYGLCLWRWPVVVLLSRERTGLEPWPWTLLVVATSLALAAGFAPAPPEAWANAGWSADARFKGC